MSSSSVLLPSYSTLLRVCLCCDGGVTDLLPFGEAFSGDPAISVFSACSRWERLLPFGEAFSGDPAISVFSACSRWERLQLLILLEQT